MGGEAAVFGILSTGLIRSVSSAPLCAGGTSVTDRPVCVDIVE